MRELFSNSLEHGLLRLDSALKGTPEGFAHYYAQRDRRLAALQDGQIVLHLEHIPMGENGMVSLRMEDSGGGFDHEAAFIDMSRNAAYCGRGIPLLRSLCRALTYRGCGNEVEAWYGW